MQQIHFSLIFSLLLQQRSEKLISPLQHVRLHQESITSTFWTESPHGLKILTYNVILLAIFNPSFHFFKVKDKSPKLLQLQEGRCTSPFSQETEQKRDWEQNTSNVSLDGIVWNKVDKMDNNTSTSKHCADLVAAGFRAQCRYEVVAPPLNSIFKGTMTLTGILELTMAKK